MFGCKVSIRAKEKPQTFTSPEPPTFTNPYTNEKLE